MRTFSTTLLAGALVLTPYLQADEKESLPEVRQETGTEIKFVVKTPDSDPPARVRIARVKREGKAIDVPGNVKLTDAGAFSWQPTPSQAGAYEIEFAAKSGDAAETTTRYRIRVQARSISAAGGPVGDLLRKWAAEGTAAGNTGDFFDNRDRDHSALNMAPYPQLDVVTYTPEQRKENRDWAMQVVLHKPVTFGNSSTSAAVQTSGSNVRSYYTNPRGLAFLYEQYRGNNLYMYPAHHDHREGRHGKPFYGDVFPVNTPYLITSQGSSGSDQPFMNAVPKTLAAFRPEVKAKLIEAGLLMPTVQMILRSSNKHLKEPKDYLTGKAHPPVFEGPWVDELKMVQTAHDIELTTLPPMVQMKVIEEDEPVPGQDAFDGPLSEKIADTPAAIARVVRGGRYVRRMVISAEDSFDVNKNPLTFTWVVLSGDRQRIEIKKLNESGSKVELRVPYHGRRPVEDNSLKLETNRVDIGAFVHNGTWYSAPGFVTFFSMDNESRTYDDAGRLLERGFGFGETEVNVSDWNALFTLLAEDNESLGAKLLKKPFKAKELEALRKHGEMYEVANRELAVARDSVKQAEEAQKKAAAAVKEKPDDGDAAAALKKAEEKLKQEKEHLDKSSKNLADVLAAKVAGMDAPVKDALEGALRQSLENPRFVEDNRSAIEASLKTADGGVRGRVAAARQRLASYGIVAADGTLQPLRPGKELTAYERCQVERFNGELLASLVYPKGVTASYRVHLVDPRLFTAKNWRDIYHYDAQGQPLGWSRYDSDRRWDFNSAGEVILERDELGRPIRTRSVRYEFDDIRKNIFAAPVEMRQFLGDKVLHYAYDSDSDTTGRIVFHDTAPAGK